MVLGEIMAGGALDLLTLVTLVTSRLSKGARVWRISTKPNTRQTKTNNQPNKETRQAAEEVNNRKESKHTNTSSLRTRGALCTGN